MKSSYSYDVTVFNTKNFKIIMGLTVPEARPHLIMLFNRQDHKKLRINIFDFTSEMFEKWVNSLKKSFVRFPETIFSQHLGLYQSKDSPHFHAHFIIPIEHYINLLSKHAKSIESDFLSKLEQWPKRLKKEGTYYKRKDIAEIKKTSSSFPKLPKISKNYSIIFHSNQPRIAFIANNSPPDHDNLADLIKAMMEFISYYGLDDRRIGGCHLCIQHNLYIDKEFNGVSGFLQVDPVNFYRINPNRIVWLNKFKNSSYIVLT